MSTCLQVYKIQSNCIDIFNTMSSSALNISNRNILENLLQDQL